MTDNIRMKRTIELTDELCGTIPKGKISETVALLVDLEYRKERHGTWIWDTSYAAKKYVRWVCSACNHWQSAQRHILSEQIFYMNYCPFCGAQMEKPEREVTRE